MQTFLEIEGKYAAEPVRFAGSNLDASGHLSLSGENSRLTVNSSNFHNFSGDNFGWFDLEIVDSADCQIWLHNALNSGRSMPGVRQGVAVGTYTTKIYPNYAVIDADQLGKARKVKQVNSSTYQLLSWSNATFSAEQTSKLEKTILANDNRY